MQSRNLIARSNNGSDISAVIRVFILTLFSPISLVEKFIERIQMSSDKCDRLKLIRELFIEYTTFFFNNSFSSFFLNLRLRNIYFLSIFLYFAQS